jgi:hypothetical protein
LANLDKDPPTKDLAGALNNLTQLYSEVDRDAEAEPRFKRPLAIMERVPGLESVDSAIELNNLAARRRAISPRFTRPKAALPRRLWGGRYPLHPRYRNSRARSMTGRRQAGRRRAAARDAGLSERGVIAEKCRSSRLRPIGLDRRRHGAAR